MSGDYCPPITKEDIAAVLCGSALPGYDVSERLEELYKDADSLGCHAAVSNVVKHVYSTLTHTAPAPTARKGPEPLSEGSDIQALVETYVVPLKPAASDPSFLVDNALLAGLVADTTEPGGFTGQLRKIEQAVLNDSSVVATLMQLTQAKGSLLYFLSLISTLLEHCMRKPDDSTSAAVPSDKVHGLSLWALPGADYVKQIRAHDAERSRLRLFLQEPYLLPLYGTPESITRNGFSGNCTCAVVSQYNYFEITVGRNELKGIRIGFMLSSNLTSHLDGDDEAESGGDCLWLLDGELKCLIKSAAQTKLLTPAAAAIPPIKSNEAGTESSLTATASIDLSGIDPKYHSFLSMRRVGVPDEAIRQHMAMMDMGSEEHLSVVFGNSSDKNETPTTTSALERAESISGDGDGDFFGSLFADVEKQNEIAARNIDQAKKERHDAMVSLNGQPLSGDKAEWTSDAIIGCYWHAAENRVVFTLNGTLMGSLDNALQPETLQQLVDPQCQSEVLVAGERLRGPKMWPVLCSSNGATLTPRLSRSDFKFFDMGSSGADNDTSCAQASMPCVRLLNGHRLVSGSSDLSGLEIKFRGSSSLPCNSFSVTACVRLLPDSGISDTTGQVISYFNSPGNLGHVTLSMLSGGRLRLCLSSVGVFESCHVQESSSSSDTEKTDDEPTVQPFNAYQWHYVAVTFNYEAKEALFYVDSAVVKSTLKPREVVGSEPSGGNSSFFIGCSPVSAVDNGCMDSGLCGDICDVRLWSTHITSSRILLCKKRGSVNSLSPELIGSWKLSEGCGGHVYDSGCRPAVTDATSTSAESSGAGIQPVPPLEAVQPPPPPPKGTVNSPTESCNLSGTFVGSWYWVDVLSSPRFTPSERVDGTGEAAMKLVVEPNPTDYCRNFVTASITDIFPLCRSFPETNDVTMASDSMSFNQCLSSVCKYVNMSATNFLQRERNVEAELVQSALRTDDYFFQHPEVALECVCHIFDKVNRASSGETMCALNNLLGLLYEVVIMLLHVVKAYVSREGQDGIFGIVSPPAYARVLVALLPFSSAGAPFYNCHGTTIVPGLAESLSTSVVNVISTGFLVFCESPRSRTYFITALLLKKRSAITPQVLSQYPLLPSVLANHELFSLTEQPINTDSDYFVAAAVLKLLSPAESDTLLKLILPSNFTTYKSIVESFLDENTVAASTRRYNAAVTTEGAPFLRAIVGDFVILHDAKGAQDDPAVTGFVVDVTDWNTQPNCGITVLWPDGSTQSYCYGAVEQVASDDGDKEWTVRRDVKIVLSKYREAHSDENVSFRFTPEEVRSCLLDTSGTCKRLSGDDIVKYLRRCCLRRQGLEVGLYDTNSDNTLQLSEIYSTLYAGSLGSYRKSLEAFDTDLLLELLIDECGSNAMNLEAPTFRLLCALHAFICGGIDDGKWNSAGSIDTTIDLTKLKSSDQGTLDFSNLLTPTIDNIKWDWSTRNFERVQLVVEEKDAGLEVQAHTPAVTSAQLAVISKALSFKDSGSGVYIFQDSRKKKVSSTKHQKWQSAEMCVMDTVLAPNTGVYNWIVHVEKFRNKDHLLLGVIKADSADMKVVGSDSFFLNRDGVVIRSGSPRFDEQKESCSFSGGHSLHFSYNSYAGSLAILVSSKKSSRRQSSDEKSDSINSEVVSISIPQGMSISPCVCLFSRGDLLSMTWEDDLGDEIWKGARKKNEQTVSSRNKEAYRSKTDVGPATCPVLSTSPFAPAKSLGKSITSAIVGGAGVRSVSSSDDSFLVSLKGCVPAPVVAHSISLLRHGSAVLRKCVAEKGSSRLSSMANPIFSIFIPGVLATLSLWQYTPAGSRSELCTELRSLLEILQPLTTPQDDTTPNDVEYVQLGNQLVVVAMAALNRLLADSVYGLGIVNVINVRSRGSVLSKDLEAHGRALRQIFCDMFPDEKVESAELPVNFTGGPSLSCSTEQTSSLFKGRKEIAEYPIKTYTNILYGYPDVSCSTSKAAVHTFVVEWLTKRDGLLPAVRRNCSDQLKSAIWKLFYTVLYHSGSLSVVDKLFCILEKLSLAGDQSLSDFFSRTTPPPFLVAAWKGATQVLMWAIQLSQSSEGEENAYDKCALVASCKASFLTMFESMQRDALCPDTEDPTALIESFRNSPSLEEDVVTVSVPILSFIKYQSKPLEEIWSACVAQERACDSQIRAYDVMRDMIGCAEGHGGVSHLGWVAKSIATVLFPDAVRGDLYRHHYNAYFRFRNNICGANAGPGEMMLPKDTDSDNGIKALRNQWAWFDFVGGRTLGIGTKLRSRLRGSIRSVYIAISEALHAVHNDTYGGGDIYEMLLIDALLVPVSPDDITLVVESNVIQLLCSIIDGKLVFGNIDSDAGDASRPSVAVAPVSVVKIAVTVFTALTTQLASLTIEDAPSTHQTTLSTAFSFVQSTIEKILSWACGDNMWEEPCRSLSYDMSLVLAELTRFIVAASSMKAIVKLFLCTSKWIALLLKLASISVLTGQQRVMRVLRNLLVHISTQDIMNMAGSDFQGLFAERDSCSMELEGCPPVADVIVQMLFTLVTKCTPLASTCRFGYLSSILKSDGYTSRAGTTAILDFDREFRNSASAGGDETNYYYAAACLNESVLCVKELLQHGDPMWRTVVESRISRTLRSVISTDTGSRPYSDDQMRVVLACFRVMGGYCTTIYPCCLVSLPPPEKSVDINRDAMIDALNNFEPSSKLSDLGGKYGVVVSIQDRNERAVVFSNDLGSYISDSSRSFTPVSAFSDNFIRWGGETMCLYLECLNAMLKAQVSCASTMDANLDCASVEENKGDTVLPIPLISFVKYAALTAFRNMCTEKRFCDYILSVSNEPVCREVMRCLFKSSVRMSESHGLADIRLIEMHLDMLLCAASDDTDEGRNKGSADSSRVSPPLLDDNGHVLNYTIFSPGLNNPSGYQTGWVCDKCQRRSMLMNTELASGRFHCAPCSVDICTDCAGRPAPSQLFDSNGHPLIFTHYEQGPRNPRGYELGWVCDHCRKQSMTMPEQWSAGRYHCPSCQSDVCIDCAKLAEGTVRQDTIEAVHGFTTPDHTLPAGAPASAEAGEGSGWEPVSENESGIFGSTGQQFSTGPIGESIYNAFVHSIESPENAKTEAVEEANVEILVSMGFSRNVCVSALVSCGNDLNEAINQLLSQDETAEMGSNDDNEEEEDDIDIRELELEASLSSQHEAAVARLPPRPQTSRGSDARRSVDSSHGPEGENGSNMPQPCLAFQNGECILGSSCSFSHDIGNAVQPFAVTEDRLSGSDEEWITTGDSPIDVNIEGYAVIGDSKPAENTEIAMHPDSTSVGGVNILGIYYVDKGQADPVMFLHDTASSSAERICYFMNGDEIVPLQARAVDGEIWVKVHARTRNEAAAGSLPNFTVVSFGWALTGRADGTTLISSAQPILASFDDAIRQTRYVINRHYAASQPLSLVSPAGSELAVFQPADVFHCLEESLHASGFLYLHTSAPNGVKGRVLKYPGAVSAAIAVPKECDIECEAEQAVSISLDQLLADEIALLEGVEDKMESFAGSSIFSKDNRLFGDMQGYPMFNEQNQENVMSSRRKKLTGGDLNRYNVKKLMGAARISESIAADLESLLVLNCRQIVLSMFLRSVCYNGCGDITRMIPKIFGSFISAGEDESSVDEFAKKLLDFIFLVTYRGTSLSCNTSEVLAVLPHQVLGLKAGIWGTESVLAGVVVRLLASAENEFCGCSSLQRSMKKSCLYMLSRQIRVACGPSYSDFNFCSPTFWNYKDAEFSTLPNIMIARWVTQVLKAGHSWSSESAIDSMSTIQHLFKVWCFSLRSPSMSLQFVGFTELASLLHMVHSASLKFNEDTEIRACSLKLLRSCMDEIPVERLFVVGQKRLFSEMEDDPAYSRYLDGLLDLLSQYQIVSSMLSEYENFDKAVVEDSSVKEQPNMKIQGVNAFTEEDSTITLSPDRDISGTWTVEFWVRRSRSEKKPVMENTSTAAPVISGHAEISSPAEAGVANADMSTGNSGSTQRPSFIPDSGSAPVSRRCASWGHSDSSAITRALLAAEEMRRGLQDVSQPGDNDDIERSPNVDLDVVPLVTPVLTRARTETREDSYGNSEEQLRRRSGTRSNRFTTLVHSILRSQRDGHGTLDLLRSQAELVGMLKNENAETPDVSSSDPSFISSTNSPGVGCVSSEYLLHSSNAFVRIQRGGCVQATDTQDPLQSEDFVADASLCMSVCTRGDSRDTVLDVVIPIEEWIHIALSYRGVNAKILDVFVNGQLKDSVSNIKMVLPLCTVGYNSSNGLASPSSERGNSAGNTQSHVSFQGYMAEMRVWCTARAEHEIVRDLYHNVTGMKDVLGVMRRPYPATFGHNQSAVEDSLCYWTSCCASKCPIVKYMSPLLEDPFPKHLAFIGGDEEEGEGIFGEEIGTSCGVVSWTGVLQIPRKATRSSSPVLSKSSSLRRGNSPSGSGGQSSAFLGGEVINICYKKIQAESGCNIEGYVEWCAYGTRSQLSGTSRCEQDQSEEIAFSISRNCAAVVGPIDDVLWFDEIHFIGTIPSTGVELTGAFRINSTVFALPQLMAGQMRLDRSMIDTVGGSVSLTLEPVSGIVLPENIEEPKVMETIRVVSEMPAKFLFTSEIKPFGSVDEESMAFPPLPRDVYSAQGGSGCDSKDMPIVTLGRNMSNTAVTYLAERHERANASSLDDFPSKRIENETFGVTSNSGIFNASWIIRSNPGKSIAIGVCTAVAVSNAEKIYKNADTWTYSCDGRVTHGRACSFVPKYEEGDIVSVEIDTFFNGSISFFKNGERVFEFFDVKRHAGVTDKYNSKQSKRSAIGLRPFCYLKQKGSSVSFLQIQPASSRPVSREHLVRVPMPYDDRLGRKLLCGRVCFGSLFGPGCLLFHRGTGFWRTFWWQGVQHGVQLWVICRDQSQSKSKSETPDKDVEVISEIKSESDLLGNVNKSVESVIDQRATTFASGKDVNVFDVVKSMDFLAVRAFLFDRGVCVRELSEAETSPFVSDFTEEINEARLGGSPPPIFPADDKFAAESPLFGTPVKAVANSRVSPTRIGSAQSSGPGNENKIGQLTVDEIRDLKLKTKAPYILRVTYENGATIREGIDIDTTGVVSSLVAGDVVEAFEKGSTSEGIGRYRIHNGWISEKLRGGKEEPVVEVLQHIPVTPLLYKIIRTDGAKVRKDISLNSSELGIIPMDTVVEIARTEILDSSTDVDKCTRLLIKRPADWASGWISDKKHIVIKVSVDNEKESEKEMRRRVTVRTNRSKRALTAKRAMEEKTGATIGLVPSQVVHEVNFSAKYETFFLLGGYGCRRSGRVQQNSVDSISLSDDFCTATVSGGRGGQNRQLVLGSRGFQRGVHYWEVQVKSAQWGSVFIGVAPQEATGWNGYGFLNYRAVQSFGKETIYGSYYNANDTIGVLLDMDHGTITFFKDVEDYSLGKIIAMDLGVAFHYLRRNTKSVAPALYPCFGMANQGDSLSILESRWVSRRGLGKASLLAETLRARSFMSAWNSAYSLSVHMTKSILQDMYQAYLRWRRQGTLEVQCRAGIPIFLDTSYESLKATVGVELCEVFVLRIGLRLVTPHGDSKILGTRRGQIWYSVVGEATGAWYWTRTQLTEQFHSGEIRVAEHGNDPDGDSVPALAVGKVSDVQEIKQSGSELKKSAELPLGRPCPPIIAEADFSSYFVGRAKEGGPWSRAEDKALASLVNDIAVHLDMDPLRISAEILLAYKHGARSASGSPRAMAGGSMNISEQQSCPQSSDNIVGSLLSRRSNESIQARYSALCVLNKAALITLPTADFSRDKQSSPLITTLFDTKFLKDTVQLTRQEEIPEAGTYRALSGHTFSCLKHVVYNRIKLDVWYRALKETTTFTPPPADEYERPDDLREIPLNRMEALSVKSGTTRLAFPNVFRNSLFGQLFRGIQKYDDRLLRRSYVHKENAGQARAFFVSFVGEGVADHSGPYRAAFEVAVGDEPANVLNLLTPTPNAKSEIGDNRDLVLFNPILSTQSSWQFNFLGKLVGMACRHKIMVPLTFPALYWKSFCRETLMTSDLHSVDEHLVNTLRMIKTMTQMTPGGDLDEDVASELLEMLEQLLNMGGVAIPSGPDGKKTLYRLGNIDANSTAPKLNAAAVNNLCELVEMKSLTSHERGLNEFFKGLSSVLPTELFAIFSDQELSDLICGRPEVDIAQLRRCTEYEEISPNDSHVGYFWEALEQMSCEEMSEFINFCSGRSRLPQNTPDKTNLKLTGPPPQSIDNPDDYLPIAQTCFFSVSLPKYTSSQICLEKLRYAIRNAHSMDADFVMRHANGWENIN